MGIGSLSSFQGSVTRHFADKFGPKDPKFQGGPKTPTFAMRKTSDFIPNTASIQIGGANGRRDLEQGINNSFSGLQEQAVNRSNAGLQGQANALQRRFSAIGAGGSGAQIKALQMAGENASQQASDASTSIGAERAKTLSSALENRDLAQADLDFKQRMANFDQGSKLHELDLAERQQQIDSAGTEYNRRLSEFQSKAPAKGLLSRAIGSIL